MGPAKSGLCNYVGSSDVAGLNEVSNGVHLGSPWLFRQGLSENFRDFMEFELAGPLSHFKGLKIGKVFVFWCVFPVVSSRLKVGMSDVEEILLEQLFPCLNHI